MDLLQLKYFQLVARLEHITKAASELNIAQPSLSQTIARLEEDLGVPLFHRQGRSIRLNESGKVFLQHVEHAFWQLEEGRKAVKEKAGQLRPTIALATIHLDVLPTFIGAYAAAHPEINFKLHQGCNRSLRQQLERGEADLCIVSPTLAHACIRCEPLLTEELLVIVPPQHPLAGRGNIRLTDIADEPLVCLKEGYGLREAINGFYAQAGLTPKVVFEVEEPSLLQQLVQSGAGVAFVPSLLFREDRATPEQKLRVTDPLCRRTIALAWNEKRGLSPEAEQLRRNIGEYFQKLYIDSKLSII